MSRRVGVVQKPFVDIQKLNLDLDAGNRLMMRDPNYIMAVGNKFAPYNLMSMFGISLTGQENGIDADPIRVGTRDWAESILKWRLIDYRRPPIQVLDSSSVPAQGNAKPGVPFVLGLSESYLDANAIIDTEDPDWQLYVQSRMSTVGAKTMYTVQIIGANPNDGSFPVRLLSYGRKLSFSGDNAVGEKSAKGQQALLRQGGYEEFYNVTQTIRTDYEASGHYLSTKRWSLLYDMFTQADGTTKSKAVGALPFGGEAFKQQFEAISHRLYYGRGNLDVTGKQIINKSPDGQYSDRPTASGLREFYYQTEHIYDYNPRQPQKLTALLNQATRIARDRMRQMNPNMQLGFDIITRTGGEEAVRQAWSDELLRGNQQLHTNLAAGGAVTVGYKIDKYITTKGDTFGMQNIDYALPRDTVREQATVNGYTADKDSWEIAIMPRYKLPEYPGRTNINVVTKKHTLDDGTVINRGLVVGYQAGMTGMTNSTGMSAGKMQDMTVSKAYLEGYKVDSMIDREAFGMLSEVSLAVYNPDDIILLKPNFPARTY